MSLVVQGLFAYFFEYFAASYMVSEKLTGTITNADGTTSAVTGMAAAAASSAPIGDMSILVGNAVLGGIGFGLMITIAVTVAIAIFGTTLSCLNTAVRVSYAMAQDEEMPEFLGVLHGRFATPHRALWVLIAVSCVIAAIGVQSVVGLTGITLASNLGTFVLYGLTCVWTIVAFVERHDRHPVRHLTIPVLGLIANIMMVSAILYLAIIGTSDTLHEAEICFIIAGAWAAITVLYVAVTSRRKGRGVLSAPAKRTA
jgi:amino acid transporter